MTVAVPATAVPLAYAAIRRNLGWYRAGRGDPTTRLSATGMVKASWTPDGPATLLVDWGDHTRDLRIEAWGPGADWAASQARAMTAVDRHDQPIVAHHPLVADAVRRHPHTLAGASGDLYQALLPTIIAQRITGDDAVRQWAQLVYRLGEPAPGPDNDLMLPPHPDRLAAQPTWWFHPLGIETKRARPLIAVARAARHLWEWSRLAPADASAKLSLIAGVGPWTIGSVLGPVFADDDAVPVGDFHFANVVAWNLAGEPRADDDRMLELLAPYAGQRGRVLRLILMHGRGAPAYGPRQRILPMARW